MYRRLIINVDNRQSSNPEITKIWQRFNQLSQWWVKDRKDGPAFITKKENSWFKNGSLIKREVFK